MCPKDTDTMANSEVPDQTESDLGLHSLLWPVYELRISMVENAPRFSFVMFIIC